MEELLNRYPLLESCKNEIIKALEAMITTYEHGGKILVCGNGGSAADCEHFVGEMMKGFMASPQGASEAKTESSKIENSEPVSVCSHCGKPLAPNAKFCMECGQKVEVLADNEMICPGCGKKTLKGKFCMECGHPLARKCPNCGSDVSRAGKFCMECGTKL